MPRQDGRLEPGQSLNGAISARAWNRMMDAADVVHGDRYSVEAVAGMPSASRLVFPMTVTGIAMDGDSFPAGAVVSLGTTMQATAFSGPGSETDQLSNPYKGYLSCAAGSASIWEPPDAREVYRSPSIGQWGVTAAPGKIGDVVPVVIRGVASVRIRLLTGGGTSYAIPATRRTTSETVASLRGILETTPCSCENAAQILGLISQARAPWTHWGVVIL